MISSRDVTVEISTKGRYESTLPLCLSSIILQTSPPGKILLFDDNDNPIDLRENFIYQNLFKLFEAASIEWKVVWGQRKGQVANHQRALELSTTRYIWRLDDDHIAEANVLQTLIEAWNTFKENSVGAIGGLVLKPDSVKVTLPRLASNKIEDIYFGINQQWFFHSSKGVRSVDHLYSTFLFDKEAAKHGYCKDLSPVGHREETMFTCDMQRKGYSVLIDPEAITWHFHAPKGGIRSYSQETLWKHDEEIFSKYLQERGIVARQLKLVVLDCGLGDHIVFRQILPEIRQKFPSHRLVLAVCYPEVFEKDMVELISIAEAKWFLGDKIENYSIYKFCYDKHWNRPLVEAFREMYL